jgi:hypothetical protein
MGWSHAFMQTRSAIAKIWHGNRPTTNSPINARHLDLMELETRVLMSATPLTLDAMTDLDSVEGDDLDAPLIASEPSFHDDFSSEMETASESPVLVADPAEDFQAFDHEGNTGALTREILFVDASVKDQEILISGLTDEIGTNSEMEIVFIDANRDGLHQITETLAEYDQLDAIHIVSHGSEGIVSLGNAHLDAAHLPAYTWEITGWSDALSQDADILFYGCDLAATDEGELLLEALAELTGADVAGSTDPTGAEDLGGDWHLEFQVGEIEASKFSDLDLAVWHHLLGEETIRDEFQLCDYTGNDGTQNWIDAWSEVSESDGACAGHVQVVSTELVGADSFALRLEAADGYGIYRDFTLADAYSATLTFDWQRDADIGFAGSDILVEVSKDSGASWTTIETIAAGGDLVAHSSEWDLASYLGEDLRLRFAAAGSGIGYVYFDNIEVRYDPTPPNHAPVIDASVTLEFDAIEEDSADHTGNTVAELLASGVGDPISDADPDADQGIAVVGLNSDHGTWEYDKLGDGNWTAFGDVSDDSATLLGLTSRIRFVPDEDYFGTDASLTFRAWDQTAGLIGDTQIDTSVTGDPTAFSAKQITAAIEVTPVNDAPRSSGIEDVSVDEDALPTTLGLFGVFEDPEQPDHELTYSVVDVTNPALFGDVRIVPNLGLLTIEYAENMHGDSNITVCATDAEGLFTDETFSVHVEPVNDAPEGSREFFSVHGDEVLRIEAPGVLANDSDVDGDPLSAVLVQRPQHGKVLFNRDGSFRYVPDPSHLGWDSFLYRASDGEAFSEPIRVWIKILVPKSPVTAGDEEVQQERPDPSADVPDLLTGILRPVTAELPDISDVSDRGFDNGDGDHDSTETQLSDSQITASDVMRQGMWQENEGGASRADLSSSSVSAWTRHADETLTTVQPQIEVATIPSINTSMSRFDTAVMCDEFDELNKLLVDDDILHQWMVGSAVGLTTGLTVGYVFWSVRAGYLLTSLIAQVPAWRIIDPLPILDSLDESSLATDNESLESIVHSPNSPG